MFNVNKKWLESGEGEIFVELPEDEKLAAWMESLQSGGAYTVDGETADAVRALFWAGCCDDAETVDVIRDVFQSDGYLCDPHTAVAVRVYEDYRARTGDKTPTVIASTASPFKFCRSVIEALGGTLEKDDVTQLDMLTGLTGVPAPAPLAALAGKAPRFDRVVDKADILSTVSLLKDL